MGEVLSDPKYFLSANYNQGKRQTVHQHTYQKKTCQPLQPYAPVKTKIGDPFTFYEIQSQPKVYDDMTELDFRHEWREYFEKNLGFGLSKPLDEIKTKEER